MGSRFGAGEQGRRSEISVGKKKGSSLSFPLLFLTFFFSPFYPFYSDHRVCEWSICWSVRRLLCFCFSVFFLNYYYWMIWRQESDSLICNCFEILMWLYCYAVIYARSMWKRIIDCLLVILKILDLVLFYYKSEGFMRNYFVCICMTRSVEIKMLFKLFMIEKDVFFFLLISIEKSSLNWVGLLLFMEQ